MTSLQARLNRDQVLQLPCGGATIDETMGTVRRFDVVGAEHA